MEWKTVKLGEVCDLIAGFAFKAGDFGDYSQKVVKIGDITPPHVTYASMSGIDLSKYDVKKLEKFKVQYGDYVLAMTGATIGKVGKYIDSTFAYLNQRVLKFKPKPEVDAQFINYVVCSAYFRQYVMNHIDSESAQPNISATTIGKYEFPLPPLDTQRRIAAILSSLDDKIENNNRINRNLEVQAQALFKSWFVDFEPWGGKMPDDWKEGTLGGMCTCYLGGTPSRAKAEYWNGMIPWINSGEVNKFRIIEGSEYITELGLKKSATKLLPKKTTVLAITGATLGQVSLLEIDACANQSVIGILENEKMPYEFIYPLIVNDIEKIILNQTGGAQQHINKDNVESHNIIIPTDEIMAKYKAIQAPLFKTIANNCFESSRLAALRDTLLPKLMKGEIEV